jgi:hypothetical protein
MHAYASSILASSAAYFACLCVSVCVCLTTGFEGCTLLLNSPGKQVRLALYMPHTKLAVLPSQPVACLLRSTLKHCLTINSWTSHCCLAAQGGRRACCAG